MGDIGELRDAGRAPPAVAGASAVHVLLVWGPHPHPHPHPNPRRERGARAARLGWARVPHVDPPRADRPPARRGLASLWTPAEAEG